MAKLNPEYTDALKCVAKCYIINEGIADSVKFLFNKAKIALTTNVFITHDYFIGPFFSGITDGRYTGSDSDPWVKFCSGVAIILHSDKSYDAVPVYAS